MRVDPRPDLATRLVTLLAAHPEGLKSPALQAALTPRVSQPTISRALTRLRGVGKVVATGEARARRYRLVGGRIGMAELRSRLLHEVVARRLLAHPELASVAGDRLKKLRKVNPQAKPYHDRWAALLAGELPPLLRALTEDSEQAAALRRESPFTVLVPKRIRDQVFRQFSPTRASTPVSGRRASIR